MNLGRSPSRNDRADERLRAISGSFPALFEDDDVADLAMFGGQRGHAQNIYCLPIGGNLSKSSIGAAGQSSDWRPD